MIEVEPDSVSPGETNAVTVGIGDLEEGDAWEVMVRRESDNGLAVECQTEEFAVEQEVTASSPPSVTLLTSPGCPVGEYYFGVRYTEVISGQQRRTPGGGLLHRRNGEGKPGPQPRPAAFGPDAAPVRFHYALADGQALPGPRR